MASKRLCLRQHLSNVEEGTFRVEKRYIKLSLDGDEVNHFICCRDPMNDADENCEVSEDRGNDQCCLAILRPSLVP